MYANVDVSGGFFTGEKMAEIIENISRDAYNTFLSFTESSKKREYHWNKPTKSEELKKYLGLVGNWIFFVKEKRWILAIQVENGIINDWKLYSRDFTLILEMKEVPYLPVLFTYEDKKPIWTKDIVEKIRFYEEILSENSSNC